MGGRNVKAKMKLEDGLGMPTRVQEAEQPLSTAERSEHPVGKWYVLALDHGHGHKLRLHESLDKHGTWINMERIGKSQLLINIDPITTPSWSLSSSPNHQMALTWDVVAIV